MTKKLRLFTIFNLIILVSTTTISIYGFIYGAGGGQNGTDMIGWNYFAPFTADSNILMAAISAFALLQILRHHRKTKPLFSGALTNLYLMTTVSLTLTFLVVTFFLIPLRFSRGENGLAMYADDMFFFHLLNPILAICSFVFLLDGAKIDRKGKLFTLIPPLIYALVYGLHVLVFKDWIDFYNFTSGGSYLASFITLLIICAITYSTATLLVCFRRKATPSKS
ncbi:hypothetical protein IKF02_01740 [Candidatus Saccharibacteria bacterium]|nr:hypothetical protein [Candidatus Saccharibacteria bacterium]